MAMERVKSPALYFLLIPLGMLGGILLSLLLGYALTIGEPPAASRPPGDPNDGPAMLGVVVTFAATAAGAVVGLFFALLLYLNERQRPQTDQ